MQPVTQQEPSLGLDDSVFMEVIDNGTPALRRKLADQLAAFLSSPDAPEAERQQVVPAALKLTADPVFEVREALAKGLSADPKLHADLLFAIISDDDEIAIPFLSATPALSHWHMLAVLRVGDPLRQAAIALRPDISAEAIGYIVDSLPLAINVLLFDNAAARFTPEQYHTLYDRFGETAEMAECLLARTDLPPAIRILHARRVASRMHQLVTARGWAPANDADEIVADAEENAVLSVLRGASAEELPRVVSFLLDGEMLTPSIIVRAACLGAMDVVAHTLAQLADVTPKRAREMMTGRSNGAFRSLHAKSGLPQSCFWTLQGACDVAREERQEGVRLTPEEFGRRLIEVLLTRYEQLPLKDRPRQLDFVGRFAADRARLIARRLKSDLMRAA